uniref:Hemicentin-1-like n=1 Tax=Elaeophora elaphi TaxID=1147741 RepID=A0A0R3RPN4_9BILA
MRILILGIIVRLLFFCQRNISVQGIHEKAAPPGTSSLTFVFDTTGSMNDDLIQVQDGAKKILDTVLKQREKLIYNYIYVPFHDPRVGPVFSTTDPRTFQRHLNSVHVVGGGDCPEMSLSGIELALKASLPASFIYVFTDARSKDYHLEDQIVNLIQEKQSSVVFVMTGDCNNRTHPGFRCYEKIAAVSFGQVHILYEIRDHSGTSLCQIPVDKSLTELTVSLSGDRDDGDYLDISLIDPTGTRVDRAQLSNESGSIDLNNIKLIRIRNPMPGIWKVRTSSRLKHTLRVLGHGAIDFKYGFVVKLVDKMELSHPRPIAHQNTYLIVYMRGLTAPGFVREISLLDYYGKELFSTPAMIHMQNPYLYYIGPFIPPRELFFVRVRGEDDRSYEFQRIAPTAISAVQTTGPRAYMADRVTAIVSQPFNLTCSVVSKGQFTLYWYKSNKQLGEPLFYPYSDTSVWTFQAITPQDRGAYHCVVTSPSGNHTATTFLEAEEPVPEITFIRNESVACGGLAFLHCRTQNLDAVIQWLKSDSVIENTAKTRLYANGTLRISDVSMQDAGIYRCRVQTSGGRAEAVMHLRVLEIPKVHVIPEQLYFVLGQSFNVSCSVDGRYFWNLLNILLAAQVYLLISQIRKQIKRIRGQRKCENRSKHASRLICPNFPFKISFMFNCLRKKENIFNLVSYGDMPPEPEWYFKGRRIIPDHQKYYITYKYDLIVQRATDADAGVYECRATNAAGSHSDSTVAQASTPPKIRFIHERQMVGRGDHVTLECIIVRGNPTPKITWFRGGRELRSYRYITIDQNKITIQGVQDSDAGSYTCVAQNLAGRDLGIVNLDVGSMPTIVPTSEVVRVNIERSITLQCRAIGYPLPKITWHRNGVPIGKLTARIKILPDGSLLINNVQLDDQDRYTCTAENIFGRQDKTTVLLVTGLVSPVLGHVPPEQKLIEGGELRLSCIPVLGTPKPTLKWYKDGKPLQSSSYVTVKSGGSILLLHKGRPQDEGRYTCVATNSAGNASLNVNIELIKKPYIKKNDASQYTTSTGKVLEIPCRVSGKPQPKVIWSIDGKPISSNGQEYEILPDNTLRIRQASSSHSGKYVCTASNAAGEAKAISDVVILGPPVIAPGQISYNLIQGNRIRLPCEVRKFKDGHIAEDGSLTIERVKEQHRGQFKCVASNSVGKDEKLITLTVHTAPTIEGSDKLKVLITNVNRSVLLPCPARAFPLPSRTWSYEGGRIYDGFSHGSEMRYTHDGSLEILTPQMNHAGRYTCHVSNLAGDDHITYLLKIHEPPKIISDIPGTIVIVLGLMLEIPCRAIGTPEPTITWEKDGFQIIPDDIVHTDSAGTLRIEKVQRSHHGIYRCMATNPAGRDERNTLVIVQEPPVISPSTLSDYTTVEGDRIELRCFASANPPPTITWSRKGILIVDGTPRMHIDEDGTLVIDNVENDDAGHYICKASNAAGDTEKVVRLTVIIPPDIPDQETVVTEAVVIGQPLSLYCPVFSIPLPQITWYLDDHSIAENDANIVLSDDQRRLHVLKSRIMDAGSYKCVARNPAGDSAKTFQVEIIVPPNVNQSTYKNKVMVLENEHIELGCPISGVPEPDIAWLVNGQLLEEGITKRDIILASGGKSIIIESAQLEHEGIYTCVGTNKGGSLDVDVHLTVLEIT